MVKTAASPPGLSAPEPMNDIGKRYCQLARGLLHVCGACGRLGVLNRLANLLMAQKGSRR
jgi:hypothetical protein